MMGNNMQICFILMKNQHTNEHKTMYHILETQLYVCISTRVCNL